MSPMRARAAVQFFRRCACVRRRRARIDAQHRRAPAFRRAVRRNDVIATPGSAHRRFSGSVRTVAFLFRPFATPNRSRARRRPILDSSGAMHIFSAGAENSGSVGVENAKIANLWQTDSRTIRRWKSDSRRKNFVARAFSTRLSRRLRWVRPYAIDAATSNRRRRRACRVVAVGRRERTRFAIRKRSNPRTISVSGPASGLRRGLQSPAKPLIFRPQTASCRPRPAIIRVQARLPA